MKEWNMLIWITQLGMSVAIPLAGFIMLGLWLKEQFGLGIWAVLGGCALGMLCAISGLRDSLKMMERMDKKNESKEPTSVSFNDHE